MDQPNTPGDVIQIYNDNGVFGGFGEMEIHGAGLTVRPEDSIDLELQERDEFVTVVGTMSASAWSDFKADGGG